MRTYEQVAADAADERPFSNSTQYEVWANSGRGCYDCANDDNEAERWCPVLTVALLGRWPAEWPHERHVDEHGTYAEVGECTEFRQRPDGGPDDDDPEPRPEPNPEPFCVGQLDLIEELAA